MAEDIKAIRDLLEKGDGVLTRRGDVWTYPGCANDPSGTNVVLPLDYVTDAHVQKALTDGHLSAAVISPAGFVSSVRLTSDEAMVVTAGLAGSAEMGTELPPNSRVELDAGSVKADPAEVERQVLDRAAAAAPAPAPAAAPKPVQPARHDGKK